MPASNDEQNLSPAPPDRSPARPPVGITSTVPVEILLAAGLTPVDLNNRFITHPDPAALVERAEGLGLPRTLCAWIKGIYAWTLDNPQVDTILAVTQGDCSNTHALMELLALNGRRVLAFDYPHGRDRAALAGGLRRLCADLGTTWEQAEVVRRELAPLRADLARLDELTWLNGQVSGEENHLWLVSASDFDGDPHSFHQRLRDFLAQTQERDITPPALPLGLLGVPPIMSGLHQTVAQMGGAIVLNEVPRQFAMLPPPAKEPWGLVEQYAAYTYPYDIFGRLEDIALEVERRGIKGLVHYTQTFCFRQVQDLVLRAKLSLPILTLEGDRCGPLDGRTRLRLEAFLEMLR
jgi:benzoyl-CoA reductase/2-hydroxyglutaryl-CoA dehydratase subunit BcrC/BadD/HgdB